MNKDLHQPYQAPRLGAAQIRLLERLCNVCAVSGEEAAVRKIVLEEIRPYRSIHMRAR